MSDSDYPELQQNMFDAHSIPLGYPEVPETPTPTVSPPTSRPRTPTMAPESSSSGK